MNSAFNPKSIMINGHIQPLAPIENLGLSEDMVEFLKKIGGINCGYRMGGKVFLVKKIGSTEDDGVLLYYLDQGYLDLVKETILKNYRD